MARLMKPALIVSLAALSVAGVGLKSMKVVAQQNLGSACSDQLPSTVLDSKLTETVSPVIRCLASEMAALRAENTALRDAVAPLSKAYVWAGRVRGDGFATDTTGSLGANRSITIRALADKPGHWHLTVSPPLPDVPAVTLSVFDGISHLSQITREGIEVEIFDNSSNPAKRDFDLVVVARQI